MLDYIQSLPWFVPVGSVAVICIIMGYLITLYHFTKVPIMSTGKKRYPMIFDYITKHIDGVGTQNAPTLIDMGCADGRFLREAERRGIPAGVGYDLSPFHIWKGKFMNLLQRSSVQLHRANFFNADLSTADIIYVFLNNNIIADVAQKILADARPNALVISLGLPLPGIQPGYTQKLDGVEGNALYFYRIPA